MSGSPENSHVPQELQTSSSGLSLQAFVQEAFFPDRVLRRSGAQYDSRKVTSVIDEDENEYVVKITEPERYTLEQLEIGREWSERCNDSGRIRATRYIKSMSGDYFLPYGSEADQFVSVMQKESLDPFIARTYTDFFLLGQSVAILHKSSEGVTAAGAPSFDYSRTNPDVEEYWDTQTDEEKALFEKILSVPNQFHMLPQQITHNDLHPGNIQFSGGKPFILDFDQLQLGPRVNDIGQTISAFWNDNTVTGFIREMNAFIAGYDGISPLSDDEIDAIPFFALRKLCISFVWFKGRADDFGTDEGQDYELYQLIKSRVITVNHFLAQYNY